MDKWSHEEQNLCRSCIYILKVCTNEFRAKENNKVIRTLLTQSALFYIKKKKRKSWEVGWSKQGSRRRWQCWSGGHGDETATLVATNGSGRRRSHQICFCCCVEIMWERQREEILVQRSLPSHYFPSWSFQSWVLVTPRHLRRCYCYWFDFFHQC